MSRFPSKSHLAACLGTALLLLLSMPLVAQEANDLDGALSINGTGRVDSSGAIRQTNAALVPTPLFSAPLYHHRAQLGGSIEFRIQSTAVGQPFVLLSGSMAPFGTPIGGELFELNFLDFAIVINGTAPTGLINSTATIGGSEVWTLNLGQGLPAGFPTTSFQAAIIDPAAAGGTRLTGTITLEVKNDIETLSRNALDSLTEAPVNPGYLLSLVTPGFIIGGSTAPQLLGDFLAGDGVDVTELLFKGMGPNTTALPPLPTGAPTFPGQLETFYVEIEEHLASPCATQPPAGERLRDYGFQALEQQGAWKWHGNQLEAEIELSLSFDASGPVPVTWLSIGVTDYYGLHGGIQTATVSGPQLASINVFGQSTSAAPGVQPIPFMYSIGNMGTEWEAGVELGTAGTSRQPYVDGTTAGPADVYQVNITWNDGSSSGPYSFLVRAAIDPATNPAGIIAAAPGNSGPPVSGILTSPGTPNASLALTFSPGTLPVTPTNVNGGMDIEMNQGLQDWYFDEFLIPTNTASQTATLCVPGLASGVSTSLLLGRLDVFGAAYDNFLTFVP